MGEGNRRISGRSVEMSRDWSAAAAAPVRPYNGRVFNRGIRCTGVAMDDDNVSRYFSFFLDIVYLGRAPRVSSPSLLTYPVYPA